jgi:hypothetical protein
MLADPRDKSQGHFCTILHDRADKSHWRSRFFEFCFRVARAAGRNLWSGNVMRFVGDAGIAVFPAKVGYSAPRPTRASRNRGQDVIMSMQNYP